MITEPRKKLRDRLSAALQESREVREKYSQLQVLVHLNETRYRGFGGILRRPGGAAGAAGTFSGGGQLSTMFEEARKYWALGYQACTKAQETMIVLSNRMKSVRERGMGSIPDTKPEHAWDAQFEKDVDVSEKGKSREKRRKKTAR